MEWTQVLTIPAILAVGVVYGTDMFFAVVARPALGHVSEASLTEVMGRLHEYADRRMPVFGVLGMVCTLGLIAVKTEPLRISGSRGAVGPPRPLLSGVKTRQCDPDRRRRSG